MKLHSAFLLLAMVLTTAAAPRIADTLPDQYTERFPNVQAAFGLAGLARLDGWTAKAQANARYMNGVLGSVPGIQVPEAPPDRTHVYYQYCVYGPEGVVRCVRRGIDIETLHVDVPPDMPLFEGTRNEREGARRAAQAIQIPVHAGLTKAQLQRVAETVRDVLASSR